MKRIKFDVSLRNHDWMDEENEVETKVAEVKNIYFAARSGDHEKLAELLGSGKSDGAKTCAQEAESFKLVNTSLAPLLTAIEKGHSKCVKVLIDHGVDVNSKGNFKTRPLHYAAILGKHECLKILLEAGADSSIPIDIPVAGTTALHLAAEYYQLKCVEELIRFGADCRAVDATGRTSLYVACEEEFKECVLTHLKNARDTAFINIPNRRNNTPLHLAVKYGMIECVQEMVRLGADVNIRNEMLMSPLHLACCSSQLNVDAKIQILKILVFDGRNTDVSTALHPGYFGVYDPEVIKFLIAYGASIDVRHDSTGHVLFEKFINWNYDSEVLKYCMNCMPQLPFLHSLNIPLDFYAAMPETFLVYNYPVLSQRADLRFARNESFLPVVPNNHVKTCALIEQPLYDVVFNHVNRELKALNSIPSHPNQSISFVMNEFLRKQYLVRLRNYLWYQKTASCPRTLQHHCRFAIRKCMGPTNIKHIKKLLLPRKLVSYLLFGCDV